MKICYIAPNPNTKDGIATYSFAFAKHLAQNGHGVILISPKSGGQRSPFHFPILDFSPQSFSSILSLWKEYSIEVIHLEYAIPTYGALSIPILFLLIYAKFFLKKKVFITLHEVKRETDLLKVIAKVYFYFLAVISNGVFVHTSQAKKILTGECLISDQKVFVVPLFLLPKEPSKHSQKLQSSKKITVFGYIHIDKGIEYFIEAVHLLNKDKKFKQSFTAVIAGDIRPRKGIFKFFQKKDEEYKQKLVNLREKFKLQKKLSLTGFLEEKALSQLLSSTDIFVIPYTNTEQSGVLHKVLQYQKPIIASNIGGLGETLATAGILVPSRNAEAIYQNLKKLLSQKLFYLRTQEKYKNLISTLNIDTVGKEVIQLYQKV